MSFLVVAVLALLWLGFFLPSYLQTRESSSPYLSATSFQESLRRLGEHRPGAPSPGSQPRAASGRRRGPTASARRRDILAALSGVVVGTSLLAVSFEGWLSWAPVPAGAALLGYVVVLRLQVVRGRRARRAAPVSAPVTPQLPPVPAEDGVVLSVRRRAAVEPAATDATQAEPLERIAG